MRLLLVIFITLFAFSEAKASHIVGGDIYYDYLGNNVYRFHLTLYRDCNSTGAQFDDPLPLTVYNAGGNLIQVVNVNFPGSTVLPVVFNNPCVTPPNNICVERAIYVTNITLPPAVGGYTITYQRCCRGPNINNLVNPADQGITLTCEVPGSETGFQANSSPRFNDYPPLLLCNNEDLIFDHSATDPDGDQLVYSLTTPLHGGSQFTVLPNPSPPPPYPPVPWAGGYNAITPLGPGSSINIDPNTGLLTASPFLLGRFVVGIQVEEIRNGVVLNKTVRDFIFQVFNCQLQLESILPLQEELPGFVSFCQGLHIDFENNSYGGTNYEWNFGDPTTTSDVSTAFEPSYTYPQEGSYQVQLVVNPGWPCTDTTTMEIKVFNPISLSILSEDTLCLTDNEFNFEAVGSGPPNLDYSWDFGSGSTPSTGNGQIVNGINFSTVGPHTVTLTGFTDYCESETTKTVYTLAAPEANFIVPEQVECLGYDITFTNTSTNATNYHWDFGDASISTDTSNALNGQYVFNGPGIYTTTLTALLGSSSCADTLSQTFEIREPIIVSFVSEDSLCVSNNSFNFDGSASGPPGMTLTWNFGSTATPSTANTEDVNNVQFAQTGPVDVYFIGQDPLCVDTAYKEIYLYQEPTIAFSMIPELQCAPFTAQFRDFSTAETGISYNWDFGDGSTSTAQNPTHVYNNVGSYPVTLTIETTTGCVATLSLTHVDLVNVHPTPVAEFFTSNDETDICHSEIMFINNSIGAEYFYYWFDDSTSFSNEENPTYEFLFPGTHYPTLYVENEWGCADSTRGKVYIEDYTFFAPNTFTPDEDEKNGTFLPVAFLGAEQWNMKIYNRWGEVVYEGTDINDAWDGTNQDGLMVQDGTYIYKVEITTCEPIDNEKTFVGHINLIR